MFVKIYKFVPYIVTLSALLSCMMALQFSLHQQFDIAVILILLASVLDCLDGKMSSPFKIVNNFGNQLSAICGAINFGIIPVIISYIWLEEAMGALELISFFAYTSSISIQLAQFASNSNAAIRSSQHSYNLFFFRGIPAPACAMLILLPPILSSQLFLPDFQYHSLNPYINIICDGYYALYVLSISILAVSNIPTFSLKYLKINTKFKFIFTIALIIFSICFYLKPILILSALCIIYLTSVPFSALLYLLIALSIWQRNKTESNKHK